jgi:hypothetical protein
VPVVYISNRNYDALVKMGVKPGDYINDLLRKHLAELEKLEGAK